MPKVFIIQKNQPFPTTFHKNMPKDCWKIDCREDVTELNPLIQFQLQTTYKKFAVSEKETNSKGEIYSIIVLSNKEYDKKDKCIFYSMCTSCYENGRGNFSYEIIVDDEYKHKPHKSTRVYHYLSSIFEPLANGNTITKIERTKIEEKSSQ